MAGRTQELMLPAKYFVYKIVLTRRTPENPVERQLNSWDVSMIMVTNEAGVQLYKTDHKAGAKALQFRAVGPPVYRLSALEYAKSTFIDGVTTELYAASYKGAITPPEDLVRNPGAVIVGWESEVQEGNALKVLWPFDNKSGSKSTPLLARGNYRLSFYCIPAE
ncbi:hypothetical protein K3G63_11190 [Hymenobacter sp. HSC-4F20]|uniref:hypothetical protein n=1 Tax=Hymenobacter sp. HSC-4F20 TaxID=2864135 RepID=UPI001C73A5FA|nr:hypothetical protein [Hymenobacter sp. HSC-4F20]MBX0291008.1 hypothetical protein [Hymenobacter sp. HSC-4F20]